MTENEAKEVVKKLRNKAELFKNSGFAVDGIVKSFEDSANAIETLSEEIQQYRAIGTVRQVQDFIADWRKYREFGTLEEIQTMKDNGSFSGIELAQLAAMQMKLKEYQKIGTIEEFKDLKEKSKIDGRVRG